MEIETVDYVNIEPEWENVARYFAHGLAEHIWDKGYKGAVGSFIEQIRYLEHKNPEFVEQLIREMKND